MNYLLDTCVISELINKQPNPQVVNWVNGLDENTVYLSVITIGEIQKGVTKLPPSKRKQELTSWLRDELLVSFKDGIVPVDLEVMLIWGELVGKLEGTGRKMPAMDSLIAAICKRHNFILVTRNEADFAHCGLDLFNPWS